MAELKLGQKIFSYSKTVLSAFQSKRRSQRKFFYMARSISKEFSILFSTIFICFGCARPFDAINSKWYRLPWPDEEGQNRLQNIEIETLDQPIQLKGKYAEIIVNPYIEDSALRGESLGRFVPTSEGVNVSLDQTTLIATTLYAHIERIRKMDEELGVSVFFQGPEIIGLNAKVEDATGHLIANNAFYDTQLDSLLVAPFEWNRFPIPANGGIIAHEHFHRIFQKVFLRGLYEQSKADGGSLYDADGANAVNPISLSLNLFRRGRLLLEDWMDQDQSAIEGSSIAKMFTDEGNNQKSLFGRMDMETMIDSAEVRNVYNQVLIRGLNEGLADFWGWVYSGRANYFAESLGSEIGNARRLDANEVNGIANRLPRVSNLKRRLFDFGSNEMVQLSTAYATGSKYARFLRSVARQLEGDDIDRASEGARRLKMAKVVIEMLPIVFQQISGQLASKSLSPNFIMEPLFKKIKKVYGEVKPSVCQEAMLFMAPAETDKEVRLNSGSGGQEVLQGESDFRTIISSNSHESYGIEAGEPPPTLELIPREQEGEKIETTERDQSNPVSDHGPKFMGVQLPLSGCEG